MGEIIDVFEKLSEFYQNTLLWEDVEKVYERLSESDKEKATEVDLKPQSPTALNKKKFRDDSMIDGGEENDQEEEADPRSAVANLPVVRRALNDPLVLSTLLELCSTLRYMREPNATYDNTYDNWNEIIKCSPRGRYLAFIYALAGLYNLDVTSVEYMKLSLVAVNAYFLTLTIPGSKRYQVFDEDVMSHCLQVFTWLERVQKSKSLSAGKIWVQFIIFFDDLKLVLRHVFFKDYIGVRDKLLRKLIEFQYSNHMFGFVCTNAAILHAKAFELYEEFINPHNGDPEETLRKLMKMTLFSHVQSARPKNSTNPNGEHISDWFIKNMAKYPKLIANVLKLYIECVVTNPFKSWTKEETERALDYAAKYDRALFTQCNESCVEFLCEAVYADEPAIRCRSIDLMSRILQLESHVNWPMFRHEVSDIPREVHLIKELILSIQDVNNVVKNKAVQALLKALHSGSPNTRKILTEGIKFCKFKDENVCLPIEPPIHKREIRYAKPNEIEANYTFPGYGLVELAILHLPEYVYTNLFHNPLLYVRRAGLVFMEHIIKLNPLIIFNTNFVSETILLSETEATALVRKQILQTADNLLELYPNCYPIIWVWCKVLAPMLKDADVKNVELAMQCFHHRVLLNMKAFDQSNLPEHFMPWVIIRTMLSTQSRLYIQNCFDTAFSNNLINNNILSVIESHLLTANSTEAWIILSFMAGKVKSKQPDALLHLFTALESNSEQIWNNEQNILIALEVMATWMNDFSHAALNNAFTAIYERFKRGQVMPVLVGRAFDLLLNISRVSQVDGSQKRAKNKALNSNHDIIPTDEKWVINLHEILEERILSGIYDFPENRTFMMSYLFSYTEANLQIRIRPDPTIISFMHKYITECLKLPGDHLDFENQRIFNSMLILTGRFSLRDACVARATCTLYGLVLRKLDSTPIVNTILVALDDLCRKHTKIVESILELVLHKLFSSYEANRMETLKFFERLILQEQLKLRGTYLLNLLAAILDPSPDLSARACYFFEEFLSKKNPSLFQKCLVECPYVLNEYMNFDGFDSFSDANLKSPLKGEACRSHRQSLYKHLMTDMDEANLVSYFGQLKLIAEKSKKDAAIRTAEGIALVKDILYILERVCKVLKDQKSNANDNTEGSADGGTGTEENLDNEMAAELAEMGLSAEEASAAEGSPKNKAKAAAASVAPGPGRGRRKRIEITMPEAMAILEKSLIFIPTIHQNLISCDLSLQKSFDNLGKALYRRFPQLIDYAQPAEFWAKYRLPNESTTSSENNTPTPTKMKREQLTDDEEDEANLQEATASESSGIDDDDDDNDDPHQPCTSAKAAKNKSYRKRDSPNAAAVTPSKRLRKRHKADKENNKTEKIGDSDDDEDKAPLMMSMRTMVSPKGAKKRHRPSCAELPMEYLFKSST